jgi:hypothetical protein
MVHFTLWNYNPYNDNYYGDHWNGEDFSIFSHPVQTAFSGNPNLVKELNGKIIPQIQEVPTPGSAFDLIETFFSENFTVKHAAHGGRALDAVVRPYAAKTAGTPLSSLFFLENLTFELVFISPKYMCSEDLAPIRQECELANTTEIFIPQFHYGEGISPKVIVSDGKWEYDAKKQTIYWKIDPLAITPVPYAENSKSPKWIAAKKSLVTRSRIEAYNFHTIQIFPADKDTALNSRRKICLIV